jgi:hypothetical protein
MNTTVNANSKAAVPPISLTRDHWGRLVFVSADETPISNIILTPLFPISEPGRWI